MSGAIVVPAHRHSRQPGKVRRRLLALLLVLGACSAPSFADVLDFTNGGGGYSYLTGSNWNSGVVPTATDQVVFDNSYTTLDNQTVTIGGSATASSWTFGSATGTSLGAFNVTSSGSAGRTVTLTSGNIAVDSTVTGQQSIAQSGGTISFVSGTGALNLTNNSTTQTLRLGSITAPGTDLYFATAGGAISVDTTGSPTFGSLNGGNGNVQINKNNSGAGRTLTLSGTGAHVFSGNISGTNVSSLALTVSGDSTFVQALNGANTYAGLTTVSSGTLLVNGTIQEANSVSITGGTIGGSGTIYRTANVSRSFTMSAGSKLVPGGAGSVGAFTVNWNPLSSSTVDISAASNDTGAYLFDLATPDASDKFVVQAGNAHFNVGTLDFADFTFNPLPGFGPGTYVLFDGYTDPTGTIHSLTGSIGNAAGTISGYDAVLSFDTTNDNVILTVTGAPEPASVGLLGVAVVGLLRRRQRS